MRSSVVLPAPLPPVSTTRSPGSTSRLTRSSASRSPYRRLTASHRIAGSDEDIGQHPGQEDDRDHAVQREEGDVDAGQVIRADDRVLVPEQRGDDGEAEVVQRAETEVHADRDQQRDGEEMADA